MCSRCVEVTVWDLLWRFSPRCRTNQDRNNPCRLQEWGRHLDVGPVCHGSPITARRTDICALWYMSVVRAHACICACVRRVLPAPRSIDDAPREPRVQDRNSTRNADGVEYIDWGCPIHTVVTFLFYGRFKIWTLPHWVMIHGNSFFNILNGVGQQRSVQLSGLERQHSASTRTTPALLIWTCL